MKKLRLLLFPISLVYGLVVWLRNFCYDKGWFQVHRLEVPIISVGNVSSGGTGKTPLAAFLLGYLAEKGMSPAYLSRGYGRKTKGFLLVEVDQGGPETFGDEALMVANRFPQFKVAVCENRVEGVKKLLKAGKVDVIILDDAFQHRRIHRDLNLLTMDANRPPHRDLLLPAGNLREALKPAIRRAEAIIIGKFSSSASAQKIVDRFPHKPIALSRYGSISLVPFQADGQPAHLELREQRFIGFSGLGNNSFFKQSLEAAGGECLGFFPFPDHHPYTSKDLLKILGKFKAEKKKSGNLSRPLIITTEKDYHRLKPLWKEMKLDQYPFYYLKVELEWVEGWKKIEFLIEQKILSQNDH